MGPWREKEIQDLEGDYARAEHALGLMRRGAVPPEPRYYEVFHASTSGAWPALAARLRDLFATEAAPLTQAVERLHAEFIARQGPADQLEDVSARMSDTIVHAQAALGPVLASVATYVDTLTEASERLSGGLNTDGLKRLTEDLHESTSGMASEGEELRSRLTAANDRIHALSCDLETLRREAMIDPLTGVLNRRAFEQRLALEVAESDRAGAPLALLMVDIDHFKQFNDRYGHLIGDQVLRLVSGTLAANVKGRDFVARIGGEEFAILLPNTALGDAARLAEAVRAAIEAKALVSRSTGQQLGRVTASFGVALHLRGTPGDELVAAADRCLYAAKAQGRNRVVNCDDDPAAGAAPR